MSRRRYRAESGPLVQSCGLGTGVLADGIEVASGTSDENWGKSLEPTPLRLTEFAPALPEQHAQAAPGPAASAPDSGYGPPTTATRLEKRVASRGTIFRSSPMEPCAVPQAARSPSRSGGKRLMGACGWWMPEASVVVVPVSYVSSASGMGAPPKSRAREVGSCIRSASGEGYSTGRDWSRRVHRRACIQLLQYQRVEVGMLAPVVASLPVSDEILSRAERAHSRLSWQERVVRNAREHPANQVSIHLFGVPASFATSLGPVVTA